MPNRKHEERMARTNLGELLRLSGIVTDADIQRAVALKEREHIPIGQALVRIGAATPDDVEDVAHLQERIRGDDMKVAAAAADELLQRASKAYDDAVAERPTDADGEVTRPEPIAPFRSR
jgi:hypothetical protein